MRKGLFACALLSLLGIFMWRMPNQPQAAGVTMPGAKFNSLSYAPYQAWQSPLSKSYPTGAQVAADLKLIAQQALQEARAVHASRPTTWTTRDKAAVIGSMHSMREQAMHGADQSDAPQSG